MAHLLQSACVVAIAIGANLFVLGKSFEPRVDLTHPAEAIRGWEHQSDRDGIGGGAIRGGGIGFMTLGGLGLVVPWINTLVARKPPESATPPA